jgi:uncharacterized protein
MAGKGSRGRRPQQQPRSTGGRSGGTARPRQAPHRPPVPATRRQPDDTVTAGRSAVPTTGPGIAGVVNGWAEPPAGATYPQILRGASYAWWRSLAGVLVGLSTFWVLTAVMSQAVITVAWATTAAEQNYRQYVAAAYAFERPSGMLAVNLGIATLIPIAVVLMGFVHHVRPSYLISVRARPRMRYGWICLALAVVALTVSIVASSLAGEELRLNPQRGLIGFVIVILLTSPIQAAAEEIFFRGYLMQALGSLFAQPWVGVVLSSAVFALFHGTQNLPLFVDRLVFGLVAAWLVWRTGGLEAGIAAHIANNVLAYGLAGFTSSIAALKAIRELTWVDAAFDVSAFALFAVLAYLVASRMKLSRQVSGDLGPKPVH